MDEAFVNNLRTELFNQYNTLDAVSSYIAVKEGFLESLDHDVQMMDVRLEPLDDRVVVHYTRVVDGRVRYRTSYPMRWEVFLKVTKEFKTAGHNPWTKQTFRYSPRRVNELERVSGPIVVEMSPEEAIAILQKQVVDPLAK